MYLGKHLNHELVLTSLFARPKLRACLCLNTVSTAVEKIIILIWVKTLSLWRIKQRKIIIIILLLLKFKLWLVVTVILLHKALCGYYHLVRDKGFEVKLYLWFLHFLWCFIRHLVGIYSLILNIWYVRHICHNIL